MTTDPDIDVDLKLMSFPSDRITIKKLRQRHPDQGDKLLDSNNTDSGGSAVTTMFYSEEELAGAAFRRVLGSVADPELVLDRKQIAEELADLYVEYGLAHGRHHAQELIRDFESQAESQARQRSGKSF